MVISVIYIASVTKIAIKYRYQEYLRSDLRMDRILLKFRGCLSFVSLTPVVNFPVSLGIFVRDLVGSAGSNFSIIQCAKFWSVKTKNEVPRHINIVIWSIYCNDMHIHIFKIHYVWNNAYQFNCIFLQPVWHNSDIEFIARKKFFARSRKWDLSFVF